MSVQESEEGVVGVCKIPSCRQPCDSGHVGRMLKDQSGSY